MTREQKLDRLFAAVKDMRRAQREYFRTRDRHWLKEAQRSERTVDAIITRLDTEGDWTQQDLLGGLK